MGGAAEQGRGGGRVVRGAAAEEGDCWEREGCSRAAAGRQPITPPAVDQTQFLAASPPLLCASRPSSP